MKCLSEKRPFAIIAIAFSFVLLSVPTSVWAGDVPLSHEADPDVYRVIAENENFRVIVATWQPGQQDAPHSHPANAAYRLTDCKNRIFQSGWQHRPGGWGERGFGRAPGPCA